LDRPGLRQIRFTHHLPVGHGPRPENSQHDNKAREMCEADQFAQLSLEIENSDNDSVEKQQMQRPFRQHTKPEKDPGDDPGQPRRTSFSPPAQPENQGQPRERNVERFNLDEPPFLDDSKIRQPDQSGDERAVRTETTARDGDESERDSEHAKH
jgi:hypothetical protein